MFWKSVTEKKNMTTDPFLKKNSFAFFSDDTFFLPDEYDYTRTF